MSITHVFRRRQPQRRRENRRHPHIQIRVVGIVIAKLVPGGIIIRGADLVDSGDLCRGDRVPAVRLRHKSDSLKQRTSARLETGDSVTPDINEMIM